MERELGWSPRTVASYSAGLLLLIRYAADHYRKDPDGLTLEQLTPDLVRDFLNARESLGCSPRTRNQRLAAIKAFFRYVSHNVLRASDQAARVALIRSKRWPRKTVDYLTREESDALLAATRDRSPLDVRDKAILIIALTYGLRANEILSLSWDEIDLGPNPRFSVMGKGRKRREMPLSKGAARGLRDWLAVKPPHTTTCFTNRYGEPLSNDGLGYIVKKYATIAATSSPSIARKVVTPHTLRHSCAMAVLHATKDIRAVALWLGHAAIQSAEIYLHAGHEDKLTILEMNCAGFAGGCLV